MRLGLLRQRYRLTRNHDKATKFVDACRQLEEGWRAALEETSLPDLVHKIHAIVHIVAMTGIVKAKVREDYVRLFVVRKLLLGCIFVVGAVKPDWEQLDRASLADMGPDENNHLAAFPKEWSIATISRVLFGRADRGLFASMYLCLWGAVADQWPHDEHEVLKMISSGAVLERARALARCSGHAFAPVRVLESVMAAVYGSHHSSGGEKRKTPAKSSREKRARTT